MKRILYVFAVLMICLGLMCSCSGNIGSTVDGFLDKVDKRINSFSSDETPSLTDKPIKTETDVSDGSTEKQLSEPLTVYENGSMILSVTNASSESWGYVLDITVENNSPRTVSVTSGSGKLNGLILAPSLSLEIGSESTAEGQVVWYPSQYENYEIGEISSAVFHFTAKSTDTDGTLYADSDVSVFPNGQHAAARYHLPEKNIYTDSIAMDSEFGTFTVYMCPTPRNDGNGYTIDLFLDNDSEYNVEFEITSSRINGSEYDPYWNRSLVPDSLEYSSVCWYGNPFEDDGIMPEDIDSIEFGFSVTNANDGSVLANGKYTLNTMRLENVL